MLREAGGREKVGDDDKEGGEGLFLLGTVAKVDKEREADDADLAETSLLNIIIS